MSAYELLIQFTGLVGWLLLIYSYYKDDIDKLLFIQILSSIFYCLNYLLLGAYSGLIVCFIELLKGIGYYKTDKDDLIFWISLPIYIIMMLFSFDSWISLLPIIGSIIDGFSLTKNKNIATIGSIVSNILWVIYDVIILAYSCALTDGLLVLSNISILLLGYSRLLKTNKLRIVPSRYFSRSLYKDIYKLDKKNYGEEFSWSYEYEKTLKDKTEKSLYLIKYNNSVVGYLNYLIINEEEYLKIINSDNMLKEYDINNIVNFKNHKKNYLIIESINIEHKFSNEVAINLIVKKIKHIIVKALKDGCKIERVLSVPLNQFEKDVLIKIGFAEAKIYNNKEVLYTLESQKILEIYEKTTKKKDYYKYKVYENEDITEEMIRAISILDNKFFKEDYLWTPDYQIELFNKNKKSLIIVTYNNKVIGYLNYLVITKEKYEEMLNSNTTIDYFNLEEVTKFYKNKKNYLTLNCVVIDKKFQDDYAVKLLTKRFKKAIKRMNDNNYKIAEINAVAVSKDGKKYLEHLKFQKVKTLDDNNVLYIFKN